MVRKVSRRAENLVAVAVRRVLLSGSVGVLAIDGSAGAAELPQPCVAGSCGPSVSSWVSSGSASATQSDNTLTINQTTDRATLNWSSFNVSADGRVIFNQPTRSSIALNRIFQDSPSRIFGQVQANGEIYLINPNGVVFGRTATVNAAGILTSTLQLSDANFAAGIASPSLIQNFQPALQSDGRVNVVDANGNPILGRLDADGRVIADPNGQPIAVQLTVQQGARIATTGAGGRVLLAGQRIENAGSITATDGQVILAAGDKVYLQASSDPALRGLLVEVGASGVVTNAATGEISTGRGNTTLIGLAVNQQGRISATTSVSANGSIRLLARDSAAVSLVDGVPAAQATRTGMLTFGAHSVTSVTSELTDTQTAVDEQQQLPSTIEGMGRQVLLEGGSQIIANGGELHLSAVANPRVTIGSNSPPAAGFHDAQSQLRIESGARIDLSGSDATLPMSRNMITVELRANELRDSPEQRDSPIRGQPLVIDARVGTPLGSIAGAIAAIPKTVAERTSEGGSAVFASDGDIVVAKDAVVDVSGGQINYASGYVQTTKLIGADGKLYDVGSADPSRTYVGVLNPTYRVVDDRWGRVTEVPLVNSGQFQQGYVEGRSAGSLQFVAPSMVLNGTFQANTVAGPYQRAAAQVPTGGRFIIGLENGVGLAPTLDYRAPDVAFTDSITDVVVAPGTALPAWMTLNLSTDYLQRGFTRTLINSNGRISLALDHQLELAPGSTFSLAGRSITLDSGISSAGGAITLATRDTMGLPDQTPPAEQISIGSGVTLDVSGAWINDSPLVGGTTNTPLFHNAGSITLRLGGSLDSAALNLGDDAALLANGGAWYRNALTGGRGGSISLLTTRPDAAQDTDWNIGSNVRIEGFGVANAAGGSFTLNAPAIRIAQDSRWSGSQQLTGPDSDDYLQLGTALFSDYGFSRFQLTATRPAPLDEVSRPVFEVMPDAVVQARVLTRMLSGTAPQRPGGGTVTDFSTSFLPQLEDRQATSVSFTAGLARGPSDHAGSLSIDAGAVLEADAGSSFDFTSYGDILLAGTVRSAGGRVNANLLPPPNAGLASDAGYVAGRRIELAGTGVIDVSGALVATTTDSNLLAGRVVAGGAVSLTAGSGRVALEAGSTIDVSGGSALLDLATGAQGHPWQRQQVGSAAGSLSVTTREGAYLLGNIFATAGADDSGTQAAGTLRVAVERSVPSFFPDTYPAGNALINVTAQDLPVVGTVPAGYVGISQQMIERAGFDSVSLRAFDTTTPDGGRIVLNSGVDLSLARQISLEAPVIALAGAGEVTLHAPQVSLGDAFAAASQAVAATGTASLTVEAANIDLVGATQLTGASAADLDSTGDIRLRGANLGDGSSIGSFSIAGDLTLGAARVYGTTASQFTLTAAGGATDRIRFEQHGTSPGTPFSAGSRINVVADQIDQGGTLLAPFGSISLQAGNINLLSGSLTSVSGVGSRIPYGRVFNGVWYYDNGQVAAPPEVTGLPVRDISLQGDAVSIAPSATVDISGGGDLYAYEWVPGTGGSTDALAAGARPGMYAVVPQLAGQFAPYDPQEYAGSDLRPGDSIYLSGYGNLPAGYYPLLPARYALLPGAYLVSVVPGNGEYLPGNPSSLRDGTAVIAGYRTFGTTGLGSAQMSGVAIRPGSYGRRLAEYTDNLASGYFPARARQLELDAATVPLDAGSLSIFAGQALDARGIVKTNPAAGGEGASISVSADHLAVTGATGDGDADTVDIAAATLNAWNPARLTLGGVRSDSGAASLAVTADSVTVRSGVTLAAPDLLLAALGQLTVESGATLATPSGQGAAGSPPVLAHDSTLSFTDSASAGAAVLAVSDDQQWRINRNGVTTGGGIALAQGSTITTRGALNMDAPGGIAADGTLLVSGADVALGAAQIAFANAPQAGVLSIDAALQDSLDAARSLAFSATQSIDFSRDTSLDLTAPDSRLELRAPLLQGTGGVQVSLTADHVALGGGAAANGATPQGGTSTLVLNSAVAELTAGNLDIAGFANTSIAASAQVVASGTSSYRVSGDLDINAPWILVTSDANTTLDVAAGAVHLDAAGRSPGSSGLPQLGGALGIRAQQIVADTTIQASSGLVSLDATSSLTLGDAAFIDVAGRMVAAGGRQRGSQGGTVSLTSGGALLTAAASRIDLSAAGDSAAGTLAVAGATTVSLLGTVQAHALTRAQGGEIDLQAGTLGDFGALNDELEAGGFSRRRRVQVGAGDLVLAAGDTLSAQNVELTSTTGQVRIDGTIDASAADTKGSIRIEGGAGVTIGAAANLSTDSTGTANSGGDIVVGSQQGGLTLAATSRFSAVGPTSSGMLVLRTRVAGADVAINALPSDLSRVGGVAIAPIFTTDVSATPTSTDLANARQPAVDFVNQNGGAVLARLATGNSATVSLRPEIQLRRSGDLTLGAIDLSTWRYAGVPGTLSVTATGDIRTTGNISDGFTGTGAALALGSGESTSIDLSAGRDLLLGANTTIRTGTGNLTLGAGRDLVFGTGATAYTGGIAGAPTLALSAQSGTASVAFADQGGELRLLAGRDIVGSPVTQSVSTWQYRGTRNNANQEMPRLWGVALSSYGWNAGTLGGGDLEVRAGRDVTNLSAATADSEIVGAGNTIGHYGGGSLRVTARGDINSSEFFTGYGRMDLTAGGRFGSSRVSPLGDGLGSLLWMADTNATVTARNGVLLESVLNPTTLLVPRAPAQGPRASSFFSYSDDAALRVQSAAGDVAFHNSAERLIPYLENNVRQLSGDAALFALYPPSLDARAYTGDIYLEQTAHLFPAALGQLSLFANRDLYSNGVRGVLMSDGAAGSISSILAPSVGSTPVTELLKGAAASRHLLTSQPALIDAGRDIRDIILSVPVAAELIAGRDVTDMSLLSQNMSPDDVTLVQAGRDLTFGPEGIGSQLLTGGPGRLDILAARNIDLGFSQGVVTTGGLRNATLPFDGGADITILTGLAQLPDFASFIDKVISGSAAYRQAVVSYMQQRDGIERGQQAALDAFSNLDVAAQRPLVTRLFFAELVQAGRAANQPGGNFARGYAAIDALFAGSRLPGNENPFDGDLNMSFSRIYTLDGGNISLLAPGGMLNVGLANPPPSFGQRDPSQLGIVAQRGGSVNVFTRDDVLVNQSRIFTLLGGDIAIWSTLGNIDAGRGAKSSVSAPPPTVLIDDTGKVTIDFAAAVAGSGIRTVVTGEGVEPGDVDLIAPVGFVNAGDAGIGAAGNINIAAQTVIGLDNIQVGGASTGVPAEAGGLGAALSGVSSVGSSAAAADQTSVASTGATTDAAPIAQSVLAWLDVFIEGFGADSCAVNDRECLERQKP